MSSEPRSPGANPGEEPARQGSIGQGSAQLFLAQLLSNAGLFVGVLIIARSLGPSGRGAIAFITVTAYVVARMTKVGISQATTVFAAQRPEQRAVLLSNLLAVSIVGSLAGAGVICGLLLALPGVRPEGIGPVELGILLGGTVASSLWDASFLLGCGRTRSLATRLAVSGWINALLLGAASLAFDFDVPIAAAAWALSMAAIGVLYHAGPLLRLGLVWPDLHLLREMLRFGVRAWGGSLSLVLNARFDQILMAFITTQATLGIYAVAVNAAELLIYVPTAIADAMLPVISSEVASGADKMATDRTLRILRAAVLIGAAAVVVAAVAGPLLLPLVFGEPFRPSVSPFLWLLPGVIGYSAMSVTNGALLATGSPGRSSAGWLVCLATGIALDLVLIPAHGATGAAIAATVAFTVGGIIGVLLYRGRARFAWRELVPGPADARQIWDFAVGLARRGRPA